MPSVKRPKRRKAHAAATAPAVRVGVRRAAKRSPRARLARADVSDADISTKLRPLIRRMVAEEIEDQLDSLALAEALAEPGRIGLAELRRRLGK